MSNCTLAIFLLSLLNPFSWFGAPEDRDVKIAEKVNSLSSKMLKNKYHLSPCGTGMKIHDNVEGLYLYFNYYEPISDINEARQLLMSVCMDHYSNIVNSDELKPYLMEPFTIEDIKISLYFHAKDRGNVYHPKICRASFYGSAALFVTDDKNDIYNSPAKIEEPTQYFFDIAEGRIPPPVYKELQE